jgi:hypothetical protein
MSVEHGSHGESVTDIISTIILCFFGLGYVLDKMTETLGNKVVGGTGHGGH